MYGTMDAVQVKMYGNPAKEFPTVVIDTFGDGKSTERMSNCKLSLDQTKNFQSFRDQLCITWRDWD